MSKTLLNGSILLTAVLVGVLHYKLKPGLNEQEIRRQAAYMQSSVEWRGQIAPDFELTTTRGEHFRLSDNIGKETIVLNFFATWCGPCRAEMPELNRYFNEHKSDSFLILGIDSEETKERVTGFLDDLKVDFPAGIDTGPIQKQYGVTAFPTTVVIGVDGRLQFYESGPIVNAEVAFDNLLQANRELIRQAHVISPEQYRAQAQQHPQLPAKQQRPEPQPEKKVQLDERGARIVARMACPCGCTDKVQACTCATSQNIQKALSTEDFRDKPDDEIIQQLDKRFCVGAQ